MDKFIGKSLKQVKEENPDLKIRVMSAGPVTFAGTAEYLPRRLNVGLGTENLTFRKKKRQIGDKVLELDEVVDKNFDEGIVISVRWG